MPDAPVAVIARVDGGDRGALPPGARTLPPQKTPRRRLLALACGSLSVCVATGTRRRTITPARKRTTGWPLLCRLGRIANRVRPAEIWVRRPRSARPGPDTMHGIPRARSSLLRAPARWLRPQWWTRTPGPAGARNEASRTTATTGGRPLPMGREHAAWLPPSAWPVRLPCWKRRQRPTVPSAARCAVASAKLAALAGTSLH